MKVIPLVAVFAGLLIATPAHADTEVADLLGRAGSALRQADYAAAQSLAAKVLDAGSVRRQDRAEAWRIRGVALFFLGDAPASEAAFVAYLKLDPEGHLDPVRVPPTCIVFFEDVRARHAAEIARSRPGPKKYFLLNFVPPGGQIQNGDTTKAWLIGSAEVALLSANIATYFVLRSWCDQGPSTCDAGGQNPDRAGRARALRALNIATGVGFVAVYTYGVIDGIVNADTPRDRQPPRLSVGLGPSLSPTLTMTF